MRTLPVEPMGVKLTGGNDHAKSPGLAAHGINFDITLFRFTCYRDDVGQPSATAPRRLAKQSD